MLYEVKAVYEVKSRKRKRKRRFKDEPVSHRVLILKHLLRVDDDKNINDEKKIWGEKEIMTLK